MRFPLSSLSPTWPIRWALIGWLLAMVSACGTSQAPDESRGGTPVEPPDGVAQCAPGEPVIEMIGEVTSADAKTYEILPFFVAAGTGRIEVAYGWSDNGALPSTPLTATTLDLGVWDHHGYRNPDGFRGWPGSRQGRPDPHRGPALNPAASPARGSRPGTI